MKQGEKKTIIWDQHEPPKDYIWVHDGKAYEFDELSHQWKESEYNVANLQNGHSMKRTMIFEKNSTPPDNYIWNKDGDIHVCENEKDWKDIIPGKKINSWLIVDHTNFAEARHNQLEDYYNNYPTEAQQDGEDWPPFTAAAFPWFVVNYPFDGTIIVNIYYKNKSVLNWKPSAKVTQQGGTMVDRTYAILSVPEDLNLRDFTETVEGNEMRLDPADFKVYLTEE